MTPGSKRGRMVRVPPASVPAREYGERRDVAQRQGNQGLRVGAGAQHLQIVCVLAQERGMVCITPLGRAVVPEV